MTWPVGHPGTGLLWLSRALASVDVQRDLWLVGSRNGNGIGNTSGRNRLGVPKELKKRLQSLKHSRMRDCGLRRVRQGAGTDSPEP